MAAAIRFPQRRGYHQALKAEIDQYFADTGLSQKANAHFYVKGAVFIGGAAALFASILVLALHGAPGLLLLGLCALLGFVLAQIGFNVGHDAIHGAVSERPWVNKLLGCTFDLVGASSTTWSVAHNFVHHTYTNIPGVDHDLEPGPWMRFYERGDVRFFHRFQHLYAWFFYGFTTLIWVVKKDFVQALEKDLRSGRRPPLTVLGKVLACKVAHFALFLALPIALLPLPLWQILLGYVVVHYCLGLTLAVVFQLAHNVEGAHFPVPDATGTTEHTWAEHQMFTTANFATASPLGLFLTGGLNHQVEHHLFARICHVHYPALRPLIERVAAEHGLPYLSSPTFTAALASHYRMLKRFGRRVEVSRVLQVADHSMHGWFGAPGVPRSPSP